MATWKAGSRWEYVDDESDEEEAALNNLPDLRPARLLLAEDDDELRRSIAGQLRRKGYEVDEAFSGFEAIALIARHDAPYDLIISDLHLHGMNGLEIVDELRASPRQEDAEVPVILLGERASRETEAMAERLRAVLLEKPCDLEHLGQQAERLARPMQLGPRPS
jgi:two-component system, OmpR family, response regulator